MVVYVPKWFTCLQTVTHPSSNRIVVVIIVIIIIIIIIIDPEG